jgi:tRNA pseudouridine38-40 synthase
LEQDSHLNSYRGILQYQGTQYFGFQSQKDQRTIQGEVQTVLQKIYPQGEVKVLGSGRTDAGVHALGQVIRIDVPSFKEPSSLLRSINSLLPADIRLIELEVCDSSFHPILHAIKKEYRYYFTTRRSLSPFEKDWLVSVPYDLDIAAMNAVAQAFVGEHDFQNYFCTGTPTPSTVRTILECELVQLSCSGPIEGLLSDGQVIMFRVVGTGFLKQMVRLMVASLWAVGRGRIDFKAFEASLSGPIERHLAPVAPPQGLFLYRVEY